MIDGQQYAEINGKTRNWRSFEGLMGGVSTASSPKDEAGLGENLRNGLMGSHIEDVLS